MEDESLTMAYASGAIDAMCSKPRDDNPFDPNLDRETFEQWNRGWADYVSLLNQEIKSETAH